MLELASFPLVIALFLPFLCLQLKPLYREWINKEIKDFFDVSLDVEQWDHMVEHLVEPDIEPMIYIDFLKVWKHKSYNSQRLIIKHLV